MTVTLVATAEPGSTPPRVKLEFSGYVGPDTTVQIQRADVLGNQVFVRAANPATLTSGGWVGYDYESVFGVPGLYFTDTSVGGYFSNYVTLDGTAPWLIHPGIPDLSQPIIMERRGDLTQTITRGVHAVLGRETPVVITDGKRKAATFDLTLRTDTLDTETAMRDLLADGTPLLLQVAYPGVGRTSYDWVSVGDVTAANVVDFYGTPHVRWTLPCVVTDAPTGMLQSQWTWGGLTAARASWQDVVNHFNTWADLITDSSH